MTLRKKTFLAILATFLGVMIIGGLFAHFFFLESFRQLEIEELRGESARFHYLLGDELKELAILTKDWAAWDDTYDFIQTRNQGYIESNLVDSTFEALGLSAIIYLDDQKMIAFEDAYDAETGRRGPVDNDMRGYFLTLEIGRDSEEKNGFLAGEDGLLLYSAAPILTSNDQGPARGLLIFVRPLNDRVADHLALSLESDFSIEPADRDRLEQWKIAEGNPDFFYDDSRRDVIRFYTFLNDESGAPIFQVEQVIPRTIFQRGLASTRDLLLSIAVAGLIASVISMLALEKGLLGRLSTLSNGVANYQSGRKNGRQIIVPGVDELAALSRVIHETLEDLSDTQQDLNQHLELEKLLVNTSSKLINLPLVKLDQGINEVLKVIGQYANVDRSYILMLTDSRPYVMNNTHEWCSPGTRSVMEEMQVVDVRQFKWWFSQMKASKPVFVDDVTLLPGAAQPEKKIWQEQSIQSIATIPLFISGKLVGFLGFDAVKQKTEWTRQTGVLLEVVGSIITNALDRGRHEQDLLISQARQIRINEITQESIRKTDFESTCRSISKQIRSLLNADHGILILRSNHKDLKLFLSGRRVKLTDNKRHTVTFLLETFGSHPGIFQSDKKPSLDLELDDMGNSIIAVPLKSGKKSLGLIGLGFDESMFFPRTKKPYAHKPHRWSRWPSPRTGLWKRPNAGRKNWTPCARQSQTLHPNSRSKTSSRLS